MNSRSFGLFSMLFLLLPISTTSANNPNGHGYFPTAGHYSVGARQAPVYFPPVNAYQMRWRPTHSQLRSAAIQPMARMPDQRSQGFRFRPWQQNYRYRPRFPQYQANNYQANYQPLGYRWRPIAPRQYDYRWNNQAIHHPRSGYPAYTPQYPQVAPRLVQRRAMPFSDPYRNGYRPHRPWDMSSGQLMGRVYRSTDIRIPNHYTFRPILSGRQAYERAQAIDTRQRGLRNHPYGSQQNIPGGYNFRPVSVAKKIKHVETVSNEYVQNPFRQSAGVDRHRKMREQLTNPYFANLARTANRPGFVYPDPQRHRRMPVPDARFLYSAGIQDRPHRAAHWSGVTERPRIISNASMNFAENRYHASVAQLSDNSNSYDGRPDAEGSWYDYGKTNELPRVSQFGALDYPLMESDSTSF